MQPNAASKKALVTIAQKELNQFFAAPIAWLFLGAFLMVTLFIFFWVESFFARNIADVRPLFAWMPLLLIFLSAALTMKMWSEERKSGTLEYVVTRPVPLWQFVVGKFLACWALLALALLLTLPLPITVAMLGDLDWGPVLSGYLAALLLGGAYLAMGLFVSARCDNQIVSLILTVTLAGGFYLLGAGVLTNLVGNSTAEVMRLLGTGSRFESITRGVVDVRDLYYYGSLIVAFIVLNCFSLERGRWASDGSPQHHRVWRVGTALLVANAIFANVWLSQISAARIDTTRGGIYSISTATKHYLAQLQEPLLIRGYFSQKTHPLLAPLVPQMQDLLREYEIAGAGKVQVEIVDPTLHPELEDEANTRYGIRPTPFRVNDRHQAAVVNSYFDVLIQYGSEHQVLSFNDLIEVKAASESKMDVLLRNPEYDVTRSLKKALYAYQTGGNIFDTIKQPITLTAYVSKSDLLPKELVELNTAIEKEVRSLQQKAGDKFKFTRLEPEANNGVEAKRIADTYGFAPMALGPFSAEQFYFYVTLGQGEQLLQVDLGDFSEAVFKESLNAGIKRFTQGFTRTVAIVAPQGPDPQMAAQMGQPPPNIPRFEGLKQILGQDMNVITEDLSSGRVNPSADILILAAPTLSNDKQRFAVDQFLMRGGTLVLSTAPNSVKITRDNLSLHAYHSGLNEWLQSYGVSFSDKLVMDPQNAAFPVPVTREVGGMSFQEVRMMDYPYFASVRGDGLNQDSLITAGLPEVTMPWAASILLDPTQVAALKVTPLLSSSRGSWLGDGSEVVPTAAQLSGGFKASGGLGSQLLAVALEGKFDSYFAGKNSPLVSADTTTTAEAAPVAQAGPASQQVNRVISHSPDNARLIVFASNDVFRDQIIGMLGSSQGGTYLNSLQLAANTVDWALEDQGLLSIRSRGNFNRTLVPMELGKQQFWEYINYALALVGLFLVWVWHSSLVRARRNRFKTLLAA